MIIQIDKSLLLKIRSLCEFIPICICWQNGISKPSTSILYNFFFPAMKTNACSNFWSFSMFISTDLKYKYTQSKYRTIDNRIYIRVEFIRKKCKTAILLYCFHTAGVLHMYMLYNLLGPGISFYRKSKIIVKRRPNYEIGWFHNGPWIISLYKR